METRGLLEVPWGMLRPGVTVERAVGNLAQVMVVEPHEEAVVVLFRDGGRERHRRAEDARIVVRRRSRRANDQPGAGGAVDDLIAEFLRARDPRQIEWGADRLGASADARAIPALLARLGDAATGDDPDVEDAVCGALVALSVMERRGTWPLLSGRSTPFQPRRAT